MARPTVERQIKFGNVRIQEVGSGAHFGSTYTEKKKKEVGSRMQRQGWVFKVEFLSTYYLKNAIALVL